MPTMNDLVDAVVRCTKCGGPLGCGCWPKPVTLVCPACGKTGRVAREPEDGDAERLEIECPECLGLEGTTVPTKKPKGKRP